MKNDGIGKNTMMKNTESAKKIFGHKLPFRRGVFQSANMTGNTKATATVMGNYPQ
jgi:hypothetical protein